MLDEAFILACSILLFATALGHGPRGGGGNLAASEEEEAGLRTVAIVGTAIGNTHILTTLRCFLLTAVRKSSAVAVAFSASGLLAQQAFRFDTSVSCPFEIFIAVGYKHQLVFTILSRHIYLCLRVH